jgi:Leucine-rich repeat (LRR) protein
MTRLFMSQNSADLLKKFKKILEISQEVKKSEVAEYLGISEKELFAKMVDWGMLGFKIKNDLIVVEDIEEFSAAVDQQFIEWGENEESKIGKVEDLTPTNHSEFMDYSGTSIFWTEYIFLIELEKTERTGRIPILPEVGPEDFGMVVDKNHIVQLGLYDKLLTSIPSSIGNLIALKELSLGKNQLVALPDSIGHLIELTTLSLMKNKLIEIPESIGNLTKLKELYLVENQLINLPESIGNLTSLEILYLYSNRLNEDPEMIGDLTTLTDLSLGDNQLPEVSEWIEKLTALNELDISDNHFSRLPGRMESIFDALEKKGCKISRTLIQDLLD